METKTFALFKNLLHVIIAVYLSFKIVALTGIPTFSIDGIVLGIFCVGTFFIGVPAFCLEGYQTMVADDKNPKWYQDVILAILSAYAGGCLALFIEIPNWLDIALFVFSIMAVVGELWYLTKLYLKKQKLK